MFKNVFIFQHIMVGGPLKLLVKITFRQENNVIYSYLDRIMVPANQHLFSLVNTFDVVNFEFVRKQFPDVPVIVNIAVDPVVTGILTACCWLPWRSWCYWRPCCFFGVPANFGFPAVLLLLRFRLLLVFLLLCHPCSCCSVSPTSPHGELIGFGYFHLPTMLLLRLPNRRLVSTVARCLE